MTETYQNLSLLEVKPNKKVYYHKVIRLLNEYPKLKAAIETDQALVEFGVGLEDVFPSCTQSLHYEKSYPEQMKMLQDKEKKQRKQEEEEEFQSDTEAFAMKRIKAQKAAEKRIAEKQVKVFLIERAFEHLNDEERKLIELKYLQKPPMTDTLVMEEMGMTKKVYHQVKNDAVFTLATVLNII